MRYYPSPETGLDLREVNRAVEEAFAEHGRGNVQMPPKVYINFSHGDFRTMPGYIPSLETAGVKIVNVHPENPKSGLPTVMALTVLLSVESGIPEAILNATRLTDMRTGAAGAVAAKYLSPKREVTLGVVGSGRQAGAQVEAIAEELRIDRILVWSRNEKNALAFCEKYARFNCEQASLERACDAEVLVTTTPSRKPLIRDGWIHEGTHINAIGADAPGKEELDPGILSRAGVFVDDPAQAVHSGEINVPIREGFYAPERIRGTLGEVILGKTGRKGKDEITVFDSTGLAIQDLAIAEIAVKNGAFINLKFP
ncbi:alanine dehydrogenase [Methanolinea mesophila]|uniref:ornithine cyclodeaminase family protein n=1 Tax=Methanolinea mesophila TaxID=547055 RepID=UPI001AEAC79A|nr:ornithine cyclodeaminase family protein [Methanolinea mesophila]MBP1928040.1 alanine dehydrogenase [Methanolinea mesophila]